LLDTSRRFAVVRMSGKKERTLNTKFETKVNEN
jgi:hypothetical protein